MTLGELRKRLSCLLKDSATVYVEVLDDSGRGTHGGECEGIDVLDDGDIVLQGYREKR